MLTGKRYDTPYEEYKAERVQGFSISDDDLHSPVGEVIEESLQNEPEEQPEKAITEELQVSSHDQQPIDRLCQSKLA